MNYIKKVLKYGGAKKLLPKMASVVVLLIFTGVLDAVSIPLLIPVIGGMFGAEGAESGLLIKAKGFIASLGLPKNLDTLMAFALGLIILSFVLKLINTIQMENIRKSVTRRFRERLIKALYSAKWTVVLGLRTGEFSNIVIEKCPCTGDVYFFPLKGTAALFYSIIYIGLAIYMSWRLSLVFFVCLSVIVLINVLLSILARRYVRINLKFSNLLSADLMDRLRAAKFIFSSNLQDKTFRLLAKTNKFSLKNDYKHRVTTQGVAYFNEVAGIIVLIAVYLASKNIRFSLVELIVFIYLLRQLMPRANEILKAQQVWMVNTPNISLIIDTIEHLEASSNIDGNIEIHNIENIKFNNVCFGYSAASHVFKNISFDIFRNKMTALVGISGAGKTTIADLIAGLISPQSGSVTINGYAMQDINKSKLHDLIGYVSQDSVLFNGTIRENVCIRRDNISEDDVDRIFKIIALDKFVSNLPEKYNTEIGENGVRLSGGQRQRIALARALVVSPQLLILDEATSALDVESEAAIQSALEYMRHSLSIIVIAHRLSTVKSADIIHVIEGRKIVESGSYEELVRKKGRLYQFDRTANRDKPEMPE